MPGSQTQPTIYREINDLLEEILRRVQRILEGNFVGMYLHGSLALGDFNPATSDIDFLVATKNDLVEETIQALADLHTRMAANDQHWTRHIEGSYIPLPALRHYDPSNNRHPALRSDGSFAVDGHFNEWVIQRWVTREKGIVLAGPDPKSLIDPVLPEDLRRAAYATLQEWWAAKLIDPSLLRTPEYQAYAVQTMCRALYTLQHGEIVSKPAAVGWAMKKFGEPWGGLIAQAAAWKPGVAFDRLGEILDYIRFTLERSQQYNIP